MIIHEGSRLTVMHMMCSCLALVTQEMHFEEIMSLYFFHPTLKLGSDMNLSWGSRPNLTEFPVSRLTPRLPQHHHSVAPATASGEKSRPVGPNHVFTKPLAVAPTYSICSRSLILLRVTSSFSYGERSSAHRSEQVRTILVRVEEDEKKRKIRLMLESISVMKRKHISDLQALNTLFEILHIHPSIHS